MRLNKEPPDDAPVVQYMGPVESGQPALSPVSANTRSRGRGNIFASRRSPVGGGGGDAGAGAVVMEATAPAAAATEDEEEEEDEDLVKIKNSGTLCLGEDDACVVCLSGERGGF